MGHPDKQRTNIYNANKLESAETMVSDGAALCLCISVATAFAPHSSNRFRRPRRRLRSRYLKSLLFTFQRRILGKIYERHRPRWATQNHLRREFFDILAGGCIYNM